MASAKELGSFVLMRPLGFSRLQAALRIGACFAVFLGTLAAAPGEANKFAQRALDRYRATKAAHIADPTSTTNACVFARAVFEWAEHATNSSSRSTLAMEGISAARSAIASDPQAACSHYTLAMNLGQLARTRSLTALSIVGEMEEAFLQARALDPFMDYGGPDRYLGRLYLEAPGWPASIGNRRKALVSFRSAVDRAPGFPENHLCLLEAMEKIGSRSDWAGRFEKAKQVMAAAKTDFSGPDWEESWIYWEHLWESIQRANSRKPSVTNPKAKP